MPNKVLNAVRDWISTTELSYDWKPITSSLNITSFVAVRIV